MSWQEYGFGHFLSQCPGNSYINWPSSLSTDFMRKRDQPWVSKAHLQDGPDSCISFSITTQSSQYMNVYNTLWDSEGNNDQIDSFPMEKSSKNQPELNSII